MSCENFDPREKAAADFLDAHAGQPLVVSDLLEAIDRAKDREITRLRALVAATLHFNRPNDGR